LFHIIRSLRSCRKYFGKAYNRKKTQCWKKKVKEEVEKSGYAYFEENFSEKYKLHVFEL
jgi:hypothetical protein